MRASDRRASPFQTATTRSQRDDRFDFHTYRSTAVCSERDSSVRSSALQTSANIAFAQSSRSRATLGTLSQPLGDRASAVPFGCRKCFPFAVSG